MGKFLSVDPITAQYPMLTPYQFASNRPIGAIDLDGLEAKDLMTGKVILFPTDEKLKKLKSNDYSYWSDMLAFEKANKNTDYVFGSNLIRRQLMEYANGNLMNTDYYDVTITKLPRNMTKTDIFDYVRKNFDKFMDHDIAKFGSEREENLNAWQSKDPTGAVITFANPMDYAPVVTSKYGNDYWVFTPVWTAEDNGHPLAGHREFGLTDTKDGKFVFYTRGVDLMCQFQMLYIIKLKREVGFSIKLIN
jgi:hypothetical protein